MGTKYHSGAGSREPGATMNIEEKASKCPVPRRRHRDRGSLVTFPMTRNAWMGFVSMALLAYLFGSPRDMFLTEHVVWMLLPKMESHACVSGISRSQPKVAEKNMSWSNCDAFSGIASRPCCTVLVCIYIVVMTVDELLEG